MGKQKRTYTRKRASRSRVSVKTIEKTRGKVEMLIDFEIPNQGIIRAKTMKEARQHIRSKQ